MNGLLLTLPVALPFTTGLLSYFIRFPSKRAQNLWYGGIICLTTALAWLAILLCGAPIVREAAVGLFTRFDIKADVLVSLALLASVAIGEIFAAGEVAFIMQLGGLPEELTVAKARAGIEKPVHLTPQTA